MKNQDGPRAYLKGDIHFIKRKNHSKYLVGKLVIISYDLGLPDCFIQLYNMLFKNTKCHGTDNKHSVYLYKVEFSVVYDTGIGKKWQCIDVNIGKH